MDLAKKGRAGQTNLTAMQGKRKLLRQGLTAAFIERVLLERGIKQGDLASRAELESSYIGLLRKKKRNLGIDASNQLAAALKLPEWYVARECGLIADAPPAEDTPGVPANPLKATIISAIEMENDLHRLQRILDLIRIAQEWSDTAGALGQERQ